MLEFYEHLERVLPQGSQLLWNDWRQQPTVVFEDINYDGKNELLVSYSVENEVYTTIFTHDYAYWYAVQTTKGTNPIRIKGINLFPASVKGVGGVKWGYINEKGQFVSPVKYDDAQDFQSNGLAVVSLNGKSGLINRFGQFIVPPTYESIYSFSEGRAIVIDANGFKVINERGKVLTPKAYSFIGSFQDGLATFAGNDAKGNYLYGYLNKQGKEAIPLKYESTTDFQNSKAIVKISNGKYELIDSSGKTLQTYPHAFVGQLSEGLIAFQPTTGGKFGYMDEAGKVIIEPQFTGAQAFKNGKAVVNKDTDYRFKYGLIDRTGNFIIKPIYNDINILSENRVAIGIPIDEKAPYAGSKYGIADSSTGKKLTEFKFYTVLPYQNGFASVSDRSKTYFIDKNGQVAENLPIAKGNGTLTMEGSLIKAKIDMRLRYYTLNGMLVWSQNQIIPLNNQYRVIERKFSPNKDYLVYYPEIQGMRIKAIQKKVNQKLAQLSGVKSIEPNKQLESSFTGTFEIPFFQNRLVIIELNSYDFPFGAAHGMPFKIYAHIDLESGVFYQLKDLFKPESDYVKVLSAIIGEQIKTDPQYSYVFPDTYKGIAPDQPFYVDENNLFIYFTPYEIAPYAAGFPTFKIPFEEIDRILNKNGAFWRAFH